MLSFLSAAPVRLAPRSTRCYTARMEILQTHRLAHYSTYQIGGPADFFVEAHTEEELMEALKWAAERNTPVFVFGGGSNLLFDDEGFRGLVIRVKGGKIRVDGDQMRVDAGVSTALLVKAAAEAELTGLEAWNGLPGTVGGAVFGNAGCFGVETKDVLESARVFVPGRGVEEWRTEELNYRYRHSRLKEEGGVVLSAVFQLQKGEPTAIWARMKEVAKSRIQKQPPGPGTGSFFKNPSPNQPAGRLIDQCGLKGLRVGGAQVSEYHANFLFNVGKATAADILKLAQQIEVAVKNRFGLALEREVIYVPASRRQAENACPLE